MTHGDTSSMDAMAALSGSRVLVTGASGMIGRAVLAVLGPDTDTHAVSRHVQAARTGSHLVADGSR